MTDEANRIGKLEDKYHSVDKRQQSFEEFVRTYIDSNEKKIERMESRMDRIEDKLDNLSNQMHNLIIAGTVGVAAIVVAIALK